MGLAFFFAGAEDVSVALRFLLEEEVEAEGSAGGGERLGERDRGDSGEGDVGAVVPAVRVGSASLDTLSREGAIGEDAVMDAYAYGWREVDEM